jgi:hypothetical protein
LKPKLHPQVCPFASGETTLPAALAKRPPQARLRRRFRTAKLKSGESKELTVEAAATEVSGLALSCDSLRSVALNINTLSGGYMPIVWRRLRRSKAAELISQQKKLESGLPRCRQRLIRAISMEDVALKSGRKSDVQKILSADESEAHD